MNPIKSSQKKEISSEKRKILAPVVMIVLAILSLIAGVCGGIISSLPIGISGAIVFVLSAIGLYYYRHHLKNLFSKNSAPSNVNGGDLPSTDTQTQFPSLKQQIQEMVELASKYGTEINIDQSTLGKDKIFHDLPEVIGKPSTQDFLEALFGRDDIQDNNDPDLNFSILGRFRMTLGAHIDAPLTYICEAACDCGLISNQEFYSELKKRKDYNSLFQPAFIRANFAPALST